MLTYRKLHTVHWRKTNEKGGQDNPSITVVLILAAWGGQDHFGLPPRVQKKFREKSPPLVRVMRAQQVDYLLTVSTQGTVRPRTETSLVAEVAGKVVFISPALAAVGFFEEGEVLVRMDKREYEGLVSLHYKCTICWSGSQRKRGRGPILVQVYQGGRDLRGGLRRGAAAAPRRISGIFGFTPYLSK